MNVAAAAASPAFPAIKREKAPATMSKQTKAAEPRAAPREPPPRAGMGRIWAIQKR